MAQIDTAQCENEPIRFPGAAMPHGALLVVSPAGRTIEAVSESSAAHALARSMERARPIASRLVRVHDCLWLRMWLRPQHGPLPEAGSVLDLVCSIGGQ